MKYLWRGYIALVVCVAIGTASFAVSESGRRASAGYAPTPPVPAAASTNSAQPQRVAQAATPGQLPTTPASATRVPRTSARDRTFRDDEQVIAGFARLQPDEPATSAPSDVAVAEAITATVAMTVTDKPPSMTPEELAAAQATIRDGQARMSRARTQYRLSAIAEAEKDVADATKNLDTVRAEHVTPEDVAAAETELQTAQTDFDRVRLENANLVNVEQAEADVRAAEARLQEAQNQATPDPAARAAAEERVAVAQQQYATVVEDASARKTTAEQTMNAQAAIVQELQAIYSTAYWQNDQAQQGIDPVSGQKFSEAGLDPDAQKQHYALVFAAAQANLADGQARLDVAVAAFEAARQQEVTDVTAAQTALDQAQADLAQLPQGPDPAAIAHAQQEVDTARALLAGLQQVAPVVLEAQQHVEAAQIKLDTVKAEWATAEPLIAEAQKRLDDAQAALKLARQQAVGKGGWTWPTYGTLSSGFGKRSLTQNTNHNGIDIANATNTPIGAARAGTVAEAGWCKGYGFCVKIAHGGGFSSEYGHMASMPLVKAGDQVEAGTLIGLMGTTYDEAHGGYSTGVHLHLTIRRNGAAVDPLGYLP